MSDQPTPTDKEVGQQALASLIKSASVTAKERQNDPATRDKILRSQPNYQAPEWVKIENASMESSPASATLMEKLWELMTELYAHKWTSVHGLADESGNWAKMMGGVTKYQLADGVRLWTAAGNKWPPNAVELREACLTPPTALGIPTPEKAWREAVEASSDPSTWKFSHSIVQEAARLTDWYSIRTGKPSSDAVEKRFHKRYGDLTSKLQRGEQLVDQQKLLTQEAAEDERERAEKANDWLVQQRIHDQGLHLKTPAELRADMLEKLGIKR